jgi:hypothetical protein
LQPACRYTLVPARVLARDHHGQLERALEADLRQVVRGGLGREQVSPFQRRRKIP